MLAVETEWKAASAGPQTLPGFSGHSQLRLRLAGRDCNAQLLRYDAAAFDASAFVAAGIAMPATIQRSVQKRQAEFFFGRLAAALAIQAHGHAAAEVTIGAMREPVFPAALAGTITHTGTVAAAAVLPAHCCKGLGIDIEQPIAAGSIDSVEQLVLGPSERILLEGVAQLPYPTALALVFSAKESFYKALALAVGRIFDFSALRLEAIDLSAQRLRFVTQEALCADWPIGSRCEIGFSLLAGGEVLTAFSW
ncbi:4'-phosphopantetheinyl transferase family protein [Pseudoduganella violacea]|uniref:Enterobactin synthase component D n=1 Tax=Pseudoduganella violacea TaxID=1715466 RepID=A0A7W5FVL8_9BURK|nr:4'-phosphopantetheinyl transferase superfamily protein [Pseudoduganella violacea]MBB3120934.1 4'-phosphopantetheinyl transferase EntD [Pseudoduganella violacea]